MSVNSGVHLPGAGMPTQEDLEKARSVVGQGEEILGLWTVSSEQAMMASCLPMMPILVLPCFWPHAMVLSPCLCTCFWMNKYVLEGSQTILTNQRIYRVVDSDGCCNQNQSGDLALGDINSVGNQALTPCGNCNVESVTLGVPYGHSLANTGGGKHRANNKLQFIVDHSDEALALIRRAKNAAPAGTNNAAGVFGALQGLAAGMGAMSATPIANATEIQMAQPVEAMVMARDESKISVMDTIADLARLKENGVLTEAEFAAKKAELLQRL